MSEPVELRLYSPLQIDMIDRDAPGHSFPLQAVSQERKNEYIGMLMNTFRALQFQEDAQHAFTDPEQDWSEVCQKIVSLTRSISLIHGRLYGVYTCRSHGELSSKELDALDWHCRDQWERGWGEGYAHCPREGVSLGLYIHFWQDTAAPLLTWEDLEATMKAEQRRPKITEITLGTFWTLLAQAKDFCGGVQGEAAYWLKEQLLEIGPEQALCFYSILQGYMKLADQFGLWNAATLMMESGCYADEFESFRAWLIFQGKETYLAALKDPDSLADIPDRKDCQFEDLLHISEAAYDRLTGQMPQVVIDSKAQRRLAAKLKKDIVYNEEIGYPHEWSEVAAYLPRLTALYTTPEALRSRGQMWDHDNPRIQKARAATPKKKKARTGNKDGEIR